MGPKSSLNLMANQTSLSMPVIKAKRIRATSVTRQRLAINMSVINQSITYP
jgi:hypothetical protein